MTWVRMPNVTEQQWSQSLMNSLTNQQGSAHNNAEVTSLQLGDETLKVTEPKTWLQVKKHLRGLKGDEAAQLAGLRNYVGAVVQKRANN